MGEEVLEEHFGLVEGSLGVDALPLVGENGIQILTRITYLLNENIILSINNGNTIIDGRELGKQKAAEETMKTERELLQRRHLILINYFRKTSNSINNHRKYIKEELK